MAFLFNALWGKARARVRVHVRACVRACARARTCVCVCVCIVRWGRGGGGGGGGRGGPRAHACVCVKCNEIIYLKQTFFRSNIYFTHLSSLYKNLCSPYKSRFNWLGVGLYEPLYLVGCGLSWGIIFIAFFFLPNSVSSFDAFTCNYPGVLFQSFWHPELCPTALKPHEQ